jgi:choloylglycine hydrolase
MLKRSIKSALAKLICLAMTATIATPALACTTFRLQSQDGAWVVGRSMELGLDLESNVMLVPRQFALNAMLPGMKPGMSWTSKYGFLGINTFDLNVATDGMNEVGLTAHALYIPGFFEYQPLPADGKNVIANTDLVNWALSQFETVDQVREALGKVSVYGLDVPKIGVQPLHWAIRDAKGGSIVIEYVQGKLVVYDNPISVLTNSPNFDWHLTNLRNHINLTNINVDALKLGSTDIAPLGQGSGLLGLPGDYTPPSRFLRATALAFSSVPAPTAKGAANVAFHILNAVDIPIGAVAEKIPGKNGEKDKLMYEQTQWVTVYDLKNKIAYFRTYGNLNIRQIDMSKVDFAGKAIQYVPMSREMAVEDLTPVAKR